MSYSFDIIGVSSTLGFFNYQQSMTSPAGDRSKTYLGSYDCTLDGFMQSADYLPQPPNWDWDEVVEAMVQFWLTHEDLVHHWHLEFQRLKSDAIVVGRVAHLRNFRQDLESLFDV